MRILYVNDALIIWGGLERILIEKMNKLSMEEGYEVAMATANQGSHPVPFPVSSGVLLHDLGILFQQQYKYNGIKRLIMKFQLQRRFESELGKFISEYVPDVIVCVRMHLLSTVLKVKGSIPLVVESHSLCLAYKYDESRLLQKIKVLYERNNVRQAQKVVALTEGDAMEWKRMNTNVSVIPNIVHLNDTGVFSDYSAESAIFVGRFSKQKDVSSLIKIWSVVNQSHPDWQLHIYAGFGELYEKNIDELKKIGKNIIVHEPTEDIFNAYLNSSILLLTSLYEPFGLVIPEAMSCGLPVVAFDCPYGPADIITDGIDGFLIKNRDVDLFAQKVNSLIEDVTLRQKMGKAGIQSSRRYDYCKIIPQWKQLFSQLVETYKTN